MSATGDCFPVAFRLMLDNEGYRLCHGTVVRAEDGLHHAHAWVEHTTHQDVPYFDGSGTVAVILVAALDRSNGHDVELPAEVYRKIGQAHDVVEYTRDEACVLAASSGHYGPW